MITREITPKLKELLTRYPVVGVLGPRQVGKTTLALEVSKDRPSLYLDLESPADREKLEEAELYLTANENKLVILDEVQRVPELFRILRGLIDAGRRKGHKGGRFLVLGSASIELLQQSAETLAGRIIYVELGPFNAVEITDSVVSRDQLWLRGGFPDSFLAASDVFSLEWRRAFIKTYLERDLPQLGPRLPAETLRRFWTMLAHSQGGLFNGARLAGGLSISGSSIARYLDPMVDLMLVRRLRPWVSNAGKRLIRAPKVYVRDSGLVHALLGIQNQEDLLGHPIVGPSWEGYVIENLLSAISEGAEAYFYRTSAGAEIDLILDFAPHQRWAIEIKRSSAPRLERGFHAACEDVQPTAKFIVYPGTEGFPASQGTEVISLIEMMKLIHQQ